MEAGRWDPSGRRYTLADIAPGTRPYEVRAAAQRMADKRTAQHQALMAQGLGGRRSAGYVVRWVRDGYAWLD